MCGRFTLTTTGETVAEWFELADPLVLTPRYNIAPSQPVAVVREEGGRVLEARRWGLIPSWAKDPRIGNKMINARAETLLERPAYRQAFRQRRCLIPADGFYEWRRNAAGRQAFYIRDREHPVFGMAGLWEEWRDPAGKRVGSCTIITTEANPAVASVHDRMPVILRPADYGAWLDPACREPEKLETLLKPWPGDRTHLSPVSDHVNNPAHEDARCSEPVEVSG